MNIEEIKSTIEELENSDTTFSNCEKLASLYIVYEHLTTPDTIIQDDSEKELQDIFPQYQAYINIKRKYQLNQIADSALLQAMHILCVEIKEFILTLYQSTELAQERQEIQRLLSEIKEKI